MPRVTKDTHIIVPNKKAKPEEAAKVKTKPVKATNALPNASPNYKPITAAQFEELSKIWENDRRIPTKASRTAWSLARNLNPINVNSWWYRRKVVAQKFKITIPKDKYELDVGTPPLVVIKLEELPTPIPELETIGSDFAPSSSGSTDTLVDLPSSTHENLVSSTNDAYGCADKPIKDAYIHDSTVPDDVVVTSGCTLDVSASVLRESSSLPPSSPNVWPSSSLPPSSRLASPEPDLLNQLSTPESDCSLIWDHDFSTSTDDWKRIDLAAELDGPIEVPSQSSSIPSHSQLCQWSEPFFAFYTFPTWCLAGFRISYDGSVVCDCLCSPRLKSCSGDP